MKGSAEFVALLTGVMIFGAALMSVGIAGIVYARIRQLQEEEKVR